MPLDIKYYFAKPKDLEFIYQFLKDMAIEENLIYRFSQDKFSLQKSIFSSQCFAEVLIAEIDNRQVGLCLFSKTNRNFHLFKSHGIFVHDLYVDLEYRRLGIADGLIKKLREIAERRGCDRIEGVVLNQNSTAIKFCYKIADAKPVDYAHVVRIQSKL